MLISSFTMQSFSSSLCLIVELIFIPGDFTSLDILQSKLKRSVILFPLNTSRDLKIQIIFDVGSRRCPNINLDSLSLKYLQKNCPTELSDAFASMSFSTLSRLSFFTFTHKTHLTRLDRNEDGASEILFVSIRKLFNQLRFIKLTCTELE